MEAGAGGCLGTSMVGGLGNLVDLDFSDPELGLRATPWSRAFRHGEARRLPAGRVFSYSGADAGLYFITSGAVRTFLLSQGGSQKTFCVYGPGAVLGEVNLVDSSPNPWLGVALEDTVIRFLDVETARRLLRQDSDLAFSIVESLSRKLRMAGKQIGDLCFRTVRSRVACVILARTARGNDSRVGLTHDEVAQFVGTNRETVTRALREMCAQGLIRYDRGLENVVVLDRRGLTAEAAREL